MAKKLQTQIPTLNAVDGNIYSKALERVKKYGKNEGIYLSNEQLRQIVKSNKDKDADGIWFLIGKAEGTLRKTVELLPYEASASDSPTLNAVDGNIDSEALKRVKKYGKGEGIYLTNKQLKQIANSNEDADGIWFLIGDAKAEGTLRKTVELLPYEASASGSPIIIRKNLKNGFLNVDMDILDNDRKAYFHSTAIKAKVIDLPDTSLDPPQGDDTAHGPPPTQRTPPPFPE